MRPVLRLLRTAIELGTSDEADIAMFSPEERAWLRSSLLELAHNDQRITGAAITGSGAASREDQWSDVDLAFGVNTTANLPSVLSDWTAHMYDQHRALHHPQHAPGRPRVRCGYGISRLGANVPPDVREGE